MSIHTRVVVVGLGGIATAATWLALHPSSARAQAAQVPPVPDHYELSVVPDPSGQPRWVITDIRTGTMELWQREGGAFQVTRYQFGGTVGTARRVADPPPAR